MAIGVVVTEAGNYIAYSDIDNWPSGTTDAEKEALVKYVEQLVEKTLGRPFYSKSFDIEINGNDENRIFPPLYADILTVTAVRVNGLLLDATWYTYDENSVYIDLTTSGAGIGDPELVYNLTRVERTGLFPRGYNNIRIQGTYGDATIPQPIKELCIILARYENDDSLYTSIVKGAEKIGDYSYSIGAGVYKDIKVYTGIFEADKIIAQYVRQKKPVLMTP